MRKGAEAALDMLLAVCGNQLPSEAAAYRKMVQFTCPTVDMVYFPVPNKSQEAVAAIKSLEGCMVAAIADLPPLSTTTLRKNASLSTSTSTPTTKMARRHISIDMDKVATFLMSAYAVTIDGMNKSNPGVKGKIKGKVVYKHVFFFFCMYG